MRATRIVLFGLVIITILGSVALFITSNVERGPAQRFELMADETASRGDLEADAAAIVRRLQALGYRTAQAQVEGQTIQVVVYGSEPAARNTLVDAIAQDRVFVRPVECAAPPFSNMSASSAGALACGTEYAITAGALKVDTETGKPTRSVDPDPALGALPSTSPTTEVASATALLRAGVHSGFSGKRLVVGSSVFDNSGIASASTGTEGTAFTVQLTLTSAAADQYDTFAQQHFHTYVGVDLDGTVVDASLVEPKDASYTTFGGTFVISASYTESEAVALADDITSPLAAAVSLKT